jgi:FkbM family methyltransferase
MDYIEKVPPRIKVLNILKKLGLYDFIRDNYHKNIAYRNMHPKWNIEKKTVKINYKGKNMEFVLTDEKNDIYDRPLYKCEPLYFFKNELAGYINLDKIKKEGILVDIGSYQGAFAIFWKKFINNKSKIICFEPDKENIKIMKKNFNLNKIKGIKIIEKGIWNKKEVLKFSANGEAGHLNPKGNIAIKVTDLVSELRAQKIPQKSVAFIKMDIEGAEIEAIEGMKEFLSKESPQLSIATYHYREGVQTFIQIEKMLKELGFKVKTDYPKHLTTIAWKD